MNTARICVRLAQVAYELCRGISLYGMFRARERLLPKRSYARSSSSCLAETLERLGPTGTKAGQILASRSDLLGDEFCASLRRLQTHVEPLPFSTILGIIERNFGSCPISGLAAVELEPLGAGLIAQTHLARTVEGEQIVLKILRPDVRRRIALDFLFLQSLMRVFDWLRLFPSLQAAQLVRDVKESYLEQTDFLAEAKNAKEFSLNFREWPEIVVPGVIQKYTCPDILALEYLPALHTNECPCRHAASALALRMLCKMTFVDGFIHADLHSGNVALDEHRVYLVDFGLVVRLDGVARADFLELFIAMATGNGAQCARISLKYSEAKGARPDKVAFQREIESRLADFTSRSLKKFEAAGFARMIFETQRRFGLVGSNAFATTILSIITFEGVLRELAPSLDFQNEALRYLVRRGGQGVAREDRIAIYAELRDEVHKKFETAAPI